MICRAPLMTIIAANKSRSLVLGIIKTASAWKQIWLVSHVISKVSLLFISFKFRF